MNDKQHSYTFPQSTILLEVVYSAPERREGGVEERSEEGGDLGCEHEEKEKKGRKRKNEKRKRRRMRRKEKEEGKENRKETVGVGKDKPELTALDSAGVSASPVEVYVTNNSLPSITTCISHLALFPFPIPICFSTGTLPIMYS